MSAFYFQAVESLERESWAIGRSKRFSAFF
jgi:hypothetical protein